MAVSRSTAVAVVASFVATAMLSFTVYVERDLNRRILQLEDSGRSASKRSAEEADGEVGADVDTPPPINKRSLSTGRVPGGAIYTRWGRTVCPDDSELVYSGVVGGSHFDHTGGAPNYLCLARDPQWKRFSEGASGAAYIYGGEYESIHVASVFNHNPPCAVCRIANRSTVYMLPGRFKCHDGWTTEYFGYLVSSHIGHKHGYEFVCLDDNPEADPAGYRDENGALMYKVEAQCGSLPCPEYVNNREVTCAVCSK